MNLTKRLMALGALSCVVTALPAGAQANWATWTSATRGGNTGTASGTMNTTGGPVVVTYTGDVFFSQLNGSGTYYWHPSSTFTSATSGAGPTTPDMIATTGGSGTGTNTLTFAFPVNNVFMAIESLGPGSVLNFNQAFTILSQGPSAFGGSNTALTQSDTSLAGQEGNGVIEFTGPITSIRWTDPHYENWHGFTVGTDALARTVTPEPSSMVLLGSGLVGLVPMIRRRRK